MNGHVNEAIESLQPQVKYRQQPLLLRNLGNAVFEDVSSKAGTAFSQGYLARGLAVGDWNNDGAPDAIFTCIGDRPVLLRNNVGQKSSWIGLRLVGRQEQSRRNRSEIDASAW